MLAIRMQRTGRKGKAMFRVVVQDSRQTPTSGRVIAQLGNYDPHTKKVQIDKEKTSFYLKNGAQPSDRSIRLFQSEGIELPSWVNVATDRTRDVRNPEKLRRNRPAEEAPAETEAVEAATEDAATDQSAEVSAAPEAEATEVAAEAPESAEKAE